MPSENKTKPLLNTKSVRNVPERSFLTKDARNDDGRGVQIRFEVNTYSVRKFNC